MLIEILIFSLLLGVFVGLSAGYVGSIMVLEKMALVGDALSHVALPGLALGLLFNFNPFLGAFAFLFGSAVVIWQLGRTTKLSFETIVGTIFTLALAIGILLVPEPDLLEALFGDITTISLVDTIIALIISIVVISLTRTIYKKTILSLISEELAISQGVKVGRINLLYLLLVSLVVAIGIKFTGTLLVGFLVVTPAAAAKTISSNMSRYFTLSAVFGAVSSFSGILLSSYLNTILYFGGWPPLPELDLVTSFLKVTALQSIPPGPLVVLIGVVIFLITIVIRRVTKFSAV
nr:metal ABC transporter permease [Candidatus Freyarchaeota archaeon]